MRPKLIDYENPEFEKIILSLQLSSLSEAQRAKKLFNYIRDAIQFDIPVFICSASQTLALKRGQVITKNIFTMALCRAAGIKCRARIINQNMKMAKHLIGAINYYGMKILAPDKIVPHVIPEIYLNNTWLPFEPCFDTNLVRACQYSKINSFEHLIDLDFNHRTGSSDEITCNWVKETIIICDEPDEYLYDWFYRIPLLFRKILPIGLLLYQSRLKKIRSKTAI